MWEWMWESERVWQRRCVCPRESEYERESVCGREHVSMKAREWESQSLWQRRRVRQRESVYQRVNTRESDYERVSPTGKVSHSQIRERGESQHERETLTVSDSHVTDSEYEREWIREQVTHRERKSLTVRVSLSRIHSLSYLLSSRIHEPLSHMCEWLSFPVSNSLSPWVSLVFALSRIHSHVKVTHRERLSLVFTLSHIHSLSYSPSSLSPIFYSLSFPVSNFSFPVSDALSYSLSLVFALTWGSLTSRVPLSYLVCVSDSLSLPVTLSRIHSLSYSLFLVFTLSHVHSHVRVTHSKRVSLVFHSLTRIS